MTTFRKINLSRKFAPCPQCEGVAKRHSEGFRRPWEIGVDGPTRLLITFSKHYCENCRKHFSQCIDHIVMPGCRYTNRARRTAVDLVVRLGLTFEQAHYRMRRKYYVKVPVTTLHDWVVAEIVLL